mmetsp:Transcript_43699/g.98800  ORF Transcript_43699/g.98800 Transcript_43699/m.98800 type:complete len:103 (-) Transcript_43699:352-660(-)
MAILNFINILGFIILIHAAYSAAHYKGLASEFNATMEGPPLDVIVEVAVGFSIVMFGSLLSSPTLRPVKGGYDTMNKSLNLPPEFASFTHRGQALRSRYSSL